MHSLLEIENGASEAELEQAYKGKRQRYLTEIKTTSAKPRIRLLKDKLSKLDCAYAEYLEQLGEFGLNPATEPGYTDESMEVEEAREHGTASLEVPSPVSLNKGKVYPVLAVEGKLISEELNEELFFAIDGQRTSLNEDGSLDLPSGQSTVQISHPDFETWENTWEARGAIAMPLTVNLNARKALFSLEVLPRVNFRLFLNGSECPRSMDDRYEIPLHEARSITVKANGFEDYTFSLDNSPGEDKRIQVVLNPLPQYCDLVTAKIPFDAKHAESNKTVAIAAGDHMLFGRATSCLVQLCLPKKNGCTQDELFISREHFSIRKEEQRIFLVDHSSNGTYLNGKKIKCEQELTSGIFHEIGIFNPHEKKFVLRKSLLIHVDSPAPDSNEPAEPLFLTMGDLSSDKNSITHLLLFSAFSQMRENRENRIPWLQRILPALSDQRAASSLACLGEEVKLWQSENQNA